MGSHSLLLGIFPTQESNLGLPHCRQKDSLPSEPTREALRCYRENFWPTQYLKLESFQ